MAAGYDDYVVKSIFQERFQRHLPRERIHRIPDGVDLSRFVRRRRAANRQVTVAMLARLDPGRFPRQLLTLLPPLKDLGARLVIAGGGARRWELEPEIARRDLTEAVRFAGPLSAEQVPAFLAAADIGLHLTETGEEVSAAAILEMMAAGLPVVAEPKGCLPEIVKPGENGFLVARPSEVSARLAELIRSHALRRRMGEASRRQARAHSIHRHRRSMRSLVGLAGSAERARSPRRRPRRLPEALSVATWRPSLSYLVCAGPDAESTLLCEALQETGIAGFPEQALRLEALALPTAGGKSEDLSTYLASALEAGTTPNGVFGASLSLAELTALLRVLRRLADGTQAPSQWMASAFPNLRYVWLTRRDRLDQAEHAAWRAYFAACAEPPVVVSYEALVRDGAATARSVLRRLGIDAGVRPPAPARSTARSGTRARRLPRSASTRSASGSGRRGRSGR
jgi:LPS sulfotransferase NodH